MVQSLDNSSNNFIGSYQNFYKININIDCGPIPFRGRSTIEKISLMAYAGKKVNLYMPGKIFYQGLGKTKFLPKPNHPYPLPLKSQMVDPERSVIGHRSDYDRLRTYGNGPQDSNKPPQNP